MAQFTPDPAGNGSVRVRPGSAFGPGLARDMVKPITEPAGTGDWSAVLVRVGVQPAGSGWIWTVMRLDSTAVSLVVALAWSMVEPVIQTWARVVWKQIGAGLLGADLGEGLLVGPRIVVGG